MNRRDARILGLACEQAHFHTFSFLSQLALRPHSHLFNLYSVHVLSSLCLTLKVSMSPRLHVSQEFGHKTCLAIIGTDI